MRKVHFFNDIVPVFSYVGFLEGFLSLFITLSSLSQISARSTFAYFSVIFPLGTPILLNKIFYQS